MYGDFEVETCGVGAGTVHRFRMSLGRRTTDDRVRVGEPIPGRMLIESDPPASHARGLQVRGVGLPIDEAATHTTTRSCAIWPD